MAGEVKMLGVFAEPSNAAKAISALKAAACTDIRAAMPAPFPEIVAALGLPKSSLGRATFLGAITGVTAGFALCIWTALSWPLITGGKPVAALPPYVVIAFELSVLVGAIVTLTVMMVSTFLGRRRRSVPREGGKFLGDRVGVYVYGEPWVAEKLLRDNGAEEVRRVDT